MSSAMILHSFSSHYMAFVLSPSGLAALVLIIPLLWLLSLDLAKWLSPIVDTELATQVPGCVRLGMSEQRSNLLRQSTGSSGPEMGINDHIASESPPPRPKIKALFVYPLKSARGIEMSETEVQGTGLRYDRMFGLARKPPVKGDETGRTVWRFITQRESPKLALLKIELWVPKDPNEKNEIVANGGCLILRFPVSQNRFFGLLTFTQDVSLSIPLAPTASRQKSKGYSLEEFSIWKDTPLSLNVTSEIPAPVLSQLKICIGIDEAESLALFRSHDPTLRKISRSLPKEENRASKAYEVGFADAFPVTFMNITSVQALSHAMRLRLSNNRHSVLGADTVHSPEGHLDARRFRANVYVEAPTPLEEDSWLRVKIGRLLENRKGSSNLEGSDLSTNISDAGSNAASFHIACRTARCRLPNTDQLTAVVDRNEPYTTLRKTRQVDEGAKPHPVLGLSAIPLFDHAVLKVGDEIVIEESGEHYYEKMFPGK